MAVQNCPLLVIGTLEFHCSHCWYLIFGSFDLALDHTGCENISVLSFQPIAQLFVPQLPYRILNFPERFCWGGKGWKNRGIYFAATVGNAAHCGISKGRVRGALLMLSTSAEGGPGCEGAEV